MIDSSDPFVIFRRTHSMNGETTFIYRGLINWTYVLEFSNRYDSIEEAQIVIAGLQINIYFPSVKVVRFSEALILSIMSS